MVLFFRSVLGALAAAFAITSTAAPLHAKTQCDEAELKGLRERAKSIAVTLAATENISAGGKLHMSWRAAERQAVRKPLFVVISIAAPVRFDVPAVPPPPDTDADGSFVEARAQLPGFMALPPTSGGPLKMAFGKDTTRAVIALHHPGAKLTGEFDVELLEAGELRIVAAVVARTACGEKVVGTLLDRTFTVGPGIPEVVVQDPYDVEQPEKALVSADGRYRANVFADRYRIYDTQTGARLVDRAGHAVNFSPTSRFVVASTGDAGSRMFEVIDLAARKVIARPFGSFIGWTQGDAYLIAGQGAWGGLSIRSTLISRDQPAPSGDESNEADRLPAHERGAADDFLDIRHSGSCHACASWTDDSFLLDIDNGILVYSGGHMGRTDIYELDSGAVLCCEKNKTSPAEFIVKNYLVNLLRLERGWHAREPILFTHIYDALADPEAESIKDQDWFKAAIGMKEQLIVAKTVDPGAAPVQIAGLSGASLVRGDWRSSTARGSEEDVLTLKDRVSIELGRIGLDLAASYPREALPYSNSFAGEDRRGSGVNLSEEEDKRFEAKIDQRTKELEKRLAADVPNLKQLLGKHGLIEESYKPPIPYDGLGEGSLDLTRSLEGLWRWDVAGRPVWLMQLWATEGNAGIGMGMIVLLEGDGDTGSRTGGRVTDLSKELEAFWAGSYGSSAHQTRLKPNVYMDRYLVAASVAQKTITVFDLKTRRQIVLFKDVPQADLMEEVTLSRDGRYVVQLNSDGQFFIHEIEIGRLNLMGRAVDDEIIVYTPEGYYLSSYEGAHFVQLRFPGLRGLFPFQQFKSVLERPDLIKKRIEEGGGVLAAPELSPPPSLTVSRSGGGADGSLHKLDVSVRSSTGLKALSLYADAHRIKDVPLSGGEAKFSVDLPELHNARWLTLQARDAAGLVSVPQSVRLSTGKATSSALHAVIVGVDTYADPTLTLKFAEGDARRLGDALQSIAGGYYQKTSVDLRLGNKATRAQILASLERAVAAASAQDTIVFSFAGHGLADDSGRYFLTPSDFDRQTIGESGLAWADIASVLQKAKARVMVILDACHSGLSGAEQAGTNDDAAAALLGAARAPMLVLAASKGRQLSYENPSWGGGLFTYALVEALSTSRKRYDADKDGAIAVSELYRAVKSIMYANAKGQQTPWLARQDLIGDFALF